MGSIAWGLGLTLLLSTPVLAQEPSRRPPDSLFLSIYDNLRLTRAVQLEKPTIVVLVDVVGQQLSREQIAAVLRTGDSLQAQWRSVADSFGYGFEIRITGYEGILDRGANAFYGAALIAEQAVIIARPSALPRLLRYWPDPTALAAELDDYERVFRPLTPT